MVVLTAFEVYYYLLSEGERDLVFLRLHNYQLTRLADKLKEGLAVDHLVHPPLTPANLLHGSEQI